LFNVFKKLQMEIKYNKLTVFYTYFFMCDVILLHEKTKIFISNEKQNYFFIRNFFYHIF
jgi:hypothetical protein